MQPFCGPQDRCGVPASSSSAASARYSLSGSAELVLENKKGETLRHGVRRGQFAYYPAEQRHTIHNTSDEPATYLMFKWHGATRSTNGRLLETGIQEAGNPEVVSNNPRGFQSRRVLQGPTRYMSKLHGHVTTLMPGGGYEAHVDTYDVAIVVLEGVVETLGQRVSPNGVIYYAAGEPHGMTNPGENPAFYMVFEFHGPSFSAPGGGTNRRVVSRTRKRARRLARRMRGAFRRAIKWTSRSFRYRPVKSDDPLSDS